MIRDLNRTSPWWGPPCVSATCGGYPDFANLIGWGIVVGIPILAIVISFLFRDSNGVDEAAVSE